MKIRLKIWKDGAEIESRVLGEGVHRIGRSDFSDIVLNSDAISRSQIEIRINAASAYFTNMAAAGKVRLNGSPKETSEIKDGDEIQIAGFRLVISDQVGDEAEAPKADAPAENAEGAEGGFGNENAEPGFGAAGFGEAGGEAAPEGEGFGFNGDAGLEGGGLGGFGGAPSESDAPTSLEKRKESDGASLSRHETAVDLKPVVAKLLFEEGARSGEEMFLEAYEVTFGRSKKADVFLDDHRLSRLHSKIIRVGNGYRLVDLNSRNGTFVNGMRVLEHPLTSFDTIQIGDTKIKFLIHDAMLGAMDAEEGNKLVPVGGPRVLDQTKSVQLGAVQGNLALQAHMEAEQGLPALSEPQMMSSVEPPADDKRKKTTRLLLGVVVGLLIVLILLPGGDPEPVQPTEQTPAAVAADKDKLADIKVSQIPKEYSELSADIQRAIEGNYNSAIAAASQQNYAEAVSNLKRIHQYLPFYKESLSLQERYQKKLKEIEIAQAQERAKKDEVQDMQIYLQEGMDYLSQGEFERAAESFNSAIVIDPNSEAAIKGLKAAEAKVRRVEDIPPDVDPEAEKRREIQELFRQAAAALSGRSYQEAINKAKQVQEVKLESDTAHIQDAQQIIDRVLILQKEEFEPFLIQAKEKYAEGDYNASRDLCEEMAKRDPNYADASECVLRAKKQLNRLAREAYTHGYILESMNRIEEAKQYWNRARNYVREGDEYFDKVMKKLDNYQ